MKKTLIESGRADVPGCTFRDLTYQHLLNFDDITNWMELFDPIELMEQETSHQGKVQMVWAFVNLIEVIKSKVLFNVSIATLPLFYYLDALFEAVMAAI